MSPMPQFSPQEMVGLKGSLRSDPRENFTYHDRIFDNDMTVLVKASEEAYEKLLFRDAMKAGFYDLQAARDRYRDVTAAGAGMNWVLVERFILVGLGCGLGWGYC